jgi:hypothetical protein
VLAGGGLVIAVLLAVGTIVLLGSSGIGHPDEWDERVLPYVEYVERERGLEFRHPVYVDFLTPDEYAEYMRVDAADLTDDEVEELDRSVAMLRALGLFSGELDLLEVTNQLVDEGTLAVYSHGDRRIRVRGTEIDVNLQVTLVHELVHALQDQHFDLSRLSAFETSGEAAAFRALVEGDASVVERRYVDSLSVADREAYEAGSAQARDELDLGDVPEILVALFAAPYALGEPFVELVHADGGWRAVDRFLDDPPTTELELLDPQRALDGFERVEVAAPTADDGEEVVDEGDFGALTLYLVLASRLDPLAALEVADGWAGDSYIATTDPGGRLCVAVATRARSTAAQDQLRVVLGRWIDVAPAGNDATLSVDGPVVSFRSCDPGGAAEVHIVTDGLTAIGLPAVRSYLRATFAAQGIAGPQATCITDRILAEIPMDVLSDPDPAPEVIEEFQMLMFQSMSSCARV